jgi:hypothetical protein
MPLLPVVESIKRNVRMDEAFGCSCCHKSECCGELPRALDEIERLQREIARLKDPPCSNCGGSGRVPWPMTNQTVLCTQCRGYGKESFAHFAAAMEQARRDIARWDAGEIDEKDVLRLICEGLRL